MKQASIIIALAAVGLVSSDAFAQTNDHFARQRRQAASRNNAAGRVQYQWGGPTSNHRWYPNNGSRHNGTTVIRHQNVQFIPVSPFGFGFGYGYPSYGYGYPRGGGYGWNSYNRYPRFGSPYGHVHIHQEIITK